MAKKAEVFEKIGEGFEDVVETILTRKPEKNNKQAFIEELFDRFESVRNERDNVEFWFARNLQELLGYRRWENFTKAINKARESCKNSGNHEEDHFRDVRKMVHIGSNTRREIDDIILTRYACYLVAQNGDPRKLEISFAQTYFAEQTRRFELIVSGMEDYERLDAREKLKVTEQRLSSIVNQRGFTDKDFGTLRSEGDKALFGGLTTKEMKLKLGIPDNRPLADFTDTVIIKGKDFAAAMTAFNVEQNNLYGVDKITNEHVINNDTVRRALLERGIIPEALPAQEDIKKIERKIKSTERKLATIKAENTSIPDYQLSGENEYELHTIHISRDLWKIALLIMATKPAGIITIKELIAEVPNYIIIPARYKEVSAAKGEPRYVQVIKNLKSNKKNKTNFINQGYVTEIRGGYQITQKGLDFVKQEFRDFI